MITAGLATLRDGQLLRVDHQLGLGIIAGRAENVLSNEPVKEILQFGGVVRTVYNESFVFEIELGLCAELAAKVLGRVCGRSADGFGDVHHVHDDGLDAVTLALDFGLDPRHFVTVKRIADGAVNVDAPHGD